jgi:tetratricopeptide (TPR) repeat protein
MMIMAAGISGCDRGGSVESLAADAKAYAQTGDLTAALIQAKNAVAKAPENAEMRMLLANLYLDSYDALSAEKEFRKAASLGLSRQRIALGLSKALHAQGEFQKVLDESEALVGEHDPDIALLRADAFLGLKRFDEAREAYAAALKARPDNTHALTGMARFAYSQGDIAGANNYAEQAIAKNPNDAEVWMFNGGLLRAQGKSELARASISR